MRGDTGGTYTRWIGGRGASTSAGIELQPDLDRDEPSASGTESTLVTDGPFAETKEMLGGYYLIEVEYARRGDRAGRAADPAPPASVTVEIRPVVDATAEDGA